MKLPLKQIISNFLEELKDAQNKKKTSLPFIVHRIPSSPLLSQDEQGQVMVIGGSTFQKALVEKNETIRIVKKSEIKNVFFKNGAELLSLIDKELDTNTSHLGLNFAYPLSPVFANGKLEGILLAGTKENEFEGLMGKNMCQELERYIFEKQKRTVSVSAANDTICLLLSGLTKYPWNTLAGGIVGTGVNFAFFLSEDSPVNLESAAFNKFEQTEEGIYIDQNSKEKGKSLFEKELSGAYLYLHFNLLCKKRNISTPVLSATKELDALARENNNRASALARELLEQSAALVACQVAGIQLFKKKPLTFVMEGSLFWKARKYKENVQKYVRLLSPFEPAFVKIEESALMGAARLLA